ISRAPRDPYIPPLRVAQFFPPGLPARDRETESAIPRDSLPAPACSRAARRRGSRSSLATSFSFWGKRRAARPLDLASPKPVSFDSRETSAALRESPDVSLPKSLPRAEPH